METPDHQDRERPHRTLDSQIGPCTRFVGQIRQKTQQYRDRDAPAARPRCSSITSVAEPEGISAHLTHKAAPARPLRSGYQPGYGTGEIAAPGLI